MIKGTTASGFNFEIEEETLNNWELLELMQDIDNGELMKLITAMKLFFGEAQYKRLKEHLRKEGVVKIDVMSAAFTEIMGLVKNGKK